MAEMPKDPAPRERRIGALITAAKTNKRKTIDRLRAGIDRLEAAGITISARSLEKETGLSFTTIRRNAEAYTLYRQHAKFFNQKRSGPNSKQPRKQSRELLHDTLSS